MRRTSRVTRRILVTMNSRRPGAVMLNMYGPSRSWATVYTPSLLVVVFVVIDVSTFVAATSAPAMTPPLESVTAPGIVANVVCAGDGQAGRRGRREKKHNHRREGAESDAHESLLTVKSGGKGRKRYMTWSGAKTTTRETPKNPRERPAKRTATNARTSPAAGM